MEALGVMPVHPSEGRELEVLNRLSWAGPCGTADEFGLGVAVDRLGQGLVIAVADRADRGGGADLGEAFALAN